MSKENLQENDRFNVKLQKNVTLQDIVIDLQLTSRENVDQVYTILDYLYGIVSKVENNGGLLLQIQKMDLRNASFRKIDENKVEIIPQITGSAKETLENNIRNKSIQDFNKYIQLSDYYDQKIENEKLSLEECFVIILQLQSSSEEIEIPFQIQNTFVKIIAYALSKNEVSVEKRIELCCIWMNVIDAILTNKSFLFDHNLLNVLYKQIEYNLDKSTKERMKRQILKCLLNVESNGIVSDLALYLKKYLMNNKKMAQSLFYTIIALAEDEMSCYKYNASNLQNLGIEIEYQPNRNIPPYNVDEIFKENGIDLYNSKKDEIIQRYLLNEESKDLSSFNIENCNLQTLCFISNCGLTFENQEFKSIMKIIFPYMISIISQVKNDYKIINFDPANEIKEFINRSLCGTAEISAVVDMMFEFVDFDHLEEGAYEIYETISANLLAFYFDGYNKLETRNRCEAVLTSFENKINMIRNENARKHYIKCCFLYQKDSILRIGII